MHRLPEAEPSCTKTIRVLAVDDEPLFGEFVARVLQQAGFQVTSAPGGDAAIASVERFGPPDLLLTDFKMPQMDGDELAARLRRSTPDLKVLYLTGFAQALFSNRSVLWEGEAFLEKPCSPSAIVEAVSMLLYDRLDPQAPVAAQPVAALRTLLGGLAKNPSRDVV